MAVDRAQVGLGAGDYDIGVGAPAGVCAAVLLNFDGDGALGVDSLGHCLNIEVHQLGLRTDRPVDGITDCVYGTIAGAGVRHFVAVRADQFNGGGWDALVASGELDVP